MTDCTLFPHCKLENGHAGWCQRASASADLPPTYTAAEVKVLTEAALRLGRQEAAEEIAAAIDLKRDQRSYHETVGEWSEVSHGGVLLGLKEAAQIARSLPPLPQNAASDGISVPSEGPGTSEPSKAAKAPQGGSDA